MSFDVDNHDLPRWRVCVGLPCRNDKRVGEDKGTGTQLSIEFRAQLPHRGGVKVDDHHIHIAEVGVEDAQSVEFEILASDEDAFQPRVQPREGRKLVADHLGVGESLGDGVCQSSPPGSEVDYVAVGRYRESGLMNVAMAFRELGIGVMPSLMP